MMARKNRRTLAEDLAAQQRQAEISKQTAEDAAELRWRSLVDVMTSLAAVLAPERPVEPSEHHGAIDDTRDRTPPS